MLSFLSSIVDSVTIFVKFLISTISGILSVFGLIGQSFAFLSTSWGYMPSVLLVFITAGLTIVIVLHLIGR